MANDNDLRMSEMKKLIDQYYADTQNTACMLDILNLFWEGSFQIPVTAVLDEADQEQFSHAKKGDRITTKEAVRLQPDILQARDGRMWFPAFTSSDETEEVYRKRFSWVPMEGKTIISTVLNGQNLSGIVINAFSKSLVLPVPLLETGMKNLVRENTLEKGTSVSLYRTGSEEKALREAAVSFLSWQPIARKAFIAVMKQNGETSYLIAVDADPKDKNAFFGKFYASLQKLRLKYPVDFVPYSSMREQLISQNILPFYCRDSLRLKKVRVPLEDTRLFFMTEYQDEEGWPQGYSFDFESASDSHYDISADDAERLTLTLQKMMSRAENNLIILIHDWLGSTLKTPEKIESCIVSLLYGTGCTVNEFHYD